jgi:hypothetical protein
METRWRFCFLLVSLLPATVLAQVPVTGDLKAKLEDAIAAQQAGEEVIEDVKAKIIKEAPEGVLPSGTGDIATTGTSQLSAWDLIRFYCQCLWGFLASRLLL